MRLKVVICPKCQSNREDMARAIQKEISNYSLDYVLSILKRCDDCRIVLALLYRQYTGECECCGRRMSRHPECIRCGALLGPGHQHQLTIGKDGKTYCGHCKTTQPAGKMPENIDPNLIALWKNGTLPAYTKVKIRGRHYAR